MTRIGLIADIHSDLDALEAALAKLGDLGCDHVLCAGDAIDFDLPPGTEETIELLTERGVLSILGNHERWILSEGRDDRLSKSAVEWLRSLPPSWSSTIDGIRVAVHHARPGSDMDGLDEELLDTDEIPGLLAEAEADVLVVGHTHSSMVLENSCGVIVNPGALLRTLADVHSVWLLDAKSGRFSEFEPKQGGTFAVIDLPSLRLEVFNVDR